MRRQKKKTSLFTNLAEHPSGYQGVTCTRHLCECIRIHSSNIWATTIPRRQRHRPNDHRSYVFTSSKAWPLVFGRWFFEKTVFWRIVSAFLFLKSFQQFLGAATWRNEAVKRFFDVILTHCASDIVFKIIVHDKTLIGTNCMHIS